MEKLKALWKKCPKWGKALCAIAVILVIIAASAWYTFRPLDRMRLYEVDAVPREDGTLDITYHLQWEVLDDSREGPLEEVRIGLANNRCTLTDAGGDIVNFSDFVKSVTGETTFVWEDGTESPEPDIHWGVDYQIANPGGEGWLIIFRLNRSFYKGECADFWFTVHQQDMLCDGRSRVFYDFTPGWFPEMEVEQYRFTWKEEPFPIQASNEDRREDGLLIWEGSMKAGEYRTMKVFYDGETFADAKKVAWSAADLPQGGDTFQNRLRTWLSDMLSMVLVLIAVVLRIFLPGSYRRGRGYGGHRGGSGGGCACACAGCACACACAGGGRAGCSRKDFNSWRAASARNAVTSSRRPDQ